MIFKHHFPMVHEIGGLHQGSGPQGQFSRSNQMIAQNETTQTVPMISAYRKSKFQLAAIDGLAGVQGLIDRSE